MSVKSQTGPVASVEPATSGLLQRRCECGQHTVAGGECAACRRSVCAALQEPGLPIEPGIRALLEPHFGGDFTAIPARPVPTAGYRIASDDDPMEAAADRRAEQVLSGAPQSDGEADFSTVRVHTGPAAEVATEEIGALAFTFGNHIVFGAGAYRPHSTEGRRLLAHELSHVVQGSATIDAPTVWRKGAPKSSAAPKKPAPPVQDDPGRENPEAQSDPAHDQGKHKARAKHPHRKHPDPPGKPHQTDAVKAATEKTAKTAQAVAATTTDTRKAAEEQAAAKQAEPKSLSDLASGNLALIDYELAEHQRWGAAAETVGAAESGQRAEFIVQSAAKGSEVGMSFVQGAGFAIGTKALEKATETVAVALAKRAGALGAKFTPLPAVGAIIGGAMSAYQLASRDWKATGEAIGKFGKGTDEYDTLANSIDAISNVLDIASQVLNVIAGVLGVISIAMWALTVATAGGAAPLATTLSIIAAKIGIVSLVIDGINSVILKSLITLFRSLHAFTTQADPREVEDQGREIAKSAGAATGFVAGLAGAKAAEHGMGRLGKFVESRKAQDHKTPGALSGEGPTVKAEPPAEPKAGAETAAAEPAPAPKEAPPATDTKGAQPAEPPKAAAESKPPTDIVEQKPAADPIEAAKKTAAEEAKKTPAEPAKETPKESAKEAPKEAAEKPKKPKPSKKKLRGKRAKEAAKREARARETARAAEKAKAKAKPKEPPPPKPLNKKKFERARDVYAALEQLGGWFDIDIGMPKSERFAIERQNATKMAEAKTQFDKAMADAAGKSPKKRAAAEKRAQAEYDKVNAQVEAKKKEIADAAKEFWDEHGKKSERELDLDKDFDAWTEYEGPQPAKPEKPQKIASLLTDKDVAAKVDLSVPKDKRVAKESMVGKIKDMPEHGALGLEAEHPMPQAQGELILNPPEKPGAAPGKKRGPYKPENDSGVLLNRRESTIKTHGGPTTDNVRTAALKDKLASGKPIDVMQDVFLPSVNEMTRARQEAAKLPPDIVAKEKIVASALDQQGELFKMGSDPRGALEKRAADTKAQFDEKVGAIDKSLGEMKQSMSDVDTRKAAADKALQELGPKRRGDGKTRKALESEQKRLAREKASLEKQHKQATDQRQKLVTENNAEVARQAEDRAAFEKAWKEYHGGQEPKTTEADWDNFIEANFGTERGPVGDVKPDAVYPLPTSVDPMATPKSDPVAGLRGRYKDMPKHGQQALEAEHIVPGGKLREMSTLPGTEGRDLPTMFGDTAYQESPVTLLASDTSRIKTAYEGEHFRATEKPESPNDLLTGSLDRTFQAQEQAVSRREAGPAERAGELSPPRAPEPPAPVAPPAAPIEPQAVPAPEPPKAVVEEPLAPVEETPPQEVDVDEPAPTAKDEEAPEATAKDEEKAPEDEKEPKKVKTAPTLVGIQPDLDDKKGEHKKKEAGLLTNLEETGSMDQSKMSETERKWYQRATVGGALLGVAGGGLGAYAGARTGQLIAGSAITAVRAYDEARREPVVEHVNPNYAAPPCQPQEIVNLQNQVAAAKDARAKAQETSKAMAGQESKHKANTTPLDQMGKGTDDAIKGTQDHQRKVGDKKQGNSKMKQFEEDVVKNVSAAQQKASETATIRWPMRGFEKFTGLAYHLDDDGILGGAKRGILKMNADSKRFLHQLDMMDEAIAKQQSEAPERGKKVADDAKRIEQTGTESKQSEDKLKDVKKDTEALGKENQDKVAEAGKVKSNADGAAAKAGAESEQKQAKSQSLAAALQAWAQGHKQSRTSSLDATKKRLEAQGYKVLEVKEL